MVARRTTSRQAIALGLLQGPTELVPISSSAHTTLVPWLCGWPYASLDPGERKSFEVALHAGTAAALLLAGGRQRIDAPLLFAACAPPALAGLAFEETIERRFGTPATIAAGLVAGALALAVADTCGRRDRGRDDAGWRDGLLMGIAQACALVPGVSRNGATLAVCRARGFDRGAASALSRECGLPVLIGAAALRLARPGALRGGGLGGAGAAFCSTLVCGRAIRSEGSLTGWAAYRVALAGVVVRRLRQNRADG